MTIDTTTITFFVGNIEFQDIINKIQTALGTVNYTVQEYLTDQSQRSGKLQIFNAAYTMVTYSLSDPTYLAFFGNVAWDSVSSSLIS